MSTRRRSPAKEDDKTSAGLKTSISESRANELRAGFRLLDANADGRVQPDELAGMLARMGLSLPPEHVRALLHQRHPSGEVSEEEFLAWMTALQEDQQQEEDAAEDLVAAFKVFDRDQDGFITREELRGALDLMGEATSDAVLDALLPPSGKISQDDFIRILL